MNEPSEALQQFLDSMRAGGSREALESYDRGAFNILSEEERAIALQACADLIRHGTNDLRAIRLIVECGWFEVINPIAERLDRIRDHETKAAFLAFAWDWRGRQRYLTELLRLATSAGTMCRLEAVTRLGDLECRDLPEEEIAAIRETLRAAMSDTDFAVASAAEASLASWD